LDSMGAQIGSLEVRIDAIAKHSETILDDLRVFKDETIERFDELSSRTFERSIDREDLESRVLYVENRLGIVSGK